MGTGRAYGRREQAAGASALVLFIGALMPDATQSAIISACATKTGVSLLRHGYSSAGAACGTAPKPRAAARIENKTSRRILRVKFAAEKSLVSWSL